MSTLSARHAVDLASLPERMRALPIDRQRGVPIPWFVAWVNGAAEFRAADAKKWKQAVRWRWCWVCGQQLGAYLAYVLGPMCTVTRTTCEPACHRDCARWSAIHCPFLSRPRMRRREDGLPEEVVDAPGMPIDRNPGVCALWITRGFELFDDGTGRSLIRVGEPDEVEWYAEGRFATRAEVAESVRTGLPLLEAVARRDADPGGALAALERQHRAAQAWWPTDNSAG